MRRIGQGAIAQGRAHPALTYSGIVALAAALAALYVGNAIADGQLILVLLFPAAVIGLLLFDRLSLAGWCTLIILSAVATRLLVTYLGLPSLLNFVHYPLVLAFAVAAITRKDADESSPRAPAARWLLGLLLLAAISLIINFSHPLRAAIFLLIVSEPLLVIWAIQRWGIEAQTQRRVARVAAALLVIQIPIGIWQGLTIGWSDPVQGTLAGHGAGHHVLGGLFALALFVAAAAVLARRAPRLALLVMGGAALGMMVASGSIQVIFAAAVALVAMPFLVPARSLPFGFNAENAFSRAVAGAFLVVLSIVGVYLAETVVPGILDRAERLLKPDELAEVQYVMDRAETNPAALPFGSGPGTTSSRASLLLVPQLQKETSPLAVLGLKPTDEAMEIAFKTRDPWGGSAESFPSSALGVIGDLGLVGFAALLLLFLRIWQEAGRSASWLGPAARAALLMTGVLMFIDNWLEYPEFAVPLGILVGFATSRPASRAMAAAPSEERDEGTRVQEEAAAERVEEREGLIWELDAEGRAREQAAARLEADALLWELDEERQTREEAVAALTAERGRLRSELAAERRTRDELTSRLEAELDRLEAERRSREEATSGLKAELERMETELDAERRVREVALGELEAQAEGRENVRAELEAERKTREQVVAELAAEREARERILAGLEEERRERDAVVARLTGEREQLGGELDEERRAREEVTGRLDAEQKRLRSELDEERRTREQIVAALAAEREARERILAELEGERRARDEVVARLTGERARLAAELDEERRAREEVKGQLEAEQERLRGELHEERRSREATAAQLAAEREAREDEAERARLAAERERAAKEREEAARAKRERAARQRQEQRKRREQAAAAERERAAKEREEAAQAKARQPEEERKRREQAAAGERERAAKEREEAARAKRERAARQREDQRKRREQAAAVEREQAAREREEERKQREQAAAAEREQVAREHEEPPVPASTRAPWSTDDLVRAAWSPTPQQAQRRRRFRR